MTTLARRLSTADAVVVGLGSMIGAGVFAAFSPAARAVLPAGSGAALLTALAVAAAVAFANATSSAQLAAQYPVAGGTYVYGRERLGAWAGFVAGWGFVVGKTASCAAMALTFAAYAVPDGAPTAVRRAVAALAVVALAAVNYRGVTRTARVARWIVAFVLAALAVTVTVAWLGGAPALGSGLAGCSLSQAAEVSTSCDGAAGGLPGAYGVLQGAGLLFFAFAGYARVATLGEEVRDPRRAIPRAITLALGITVAVYAVVAVTLLAVLGLEGTAAAGAPLAAAVERATADGGGAAWAAAWAPPLVRVAAAAASLGALLALVAGVGRTALAMAREGDLPRELSTVHPRFRVPHHAEVALAAVVVVLVLTVDLRGAIGFSSFGVLTYYLVANLSAWTQTAPDRRYPRALQVFGAVGCAVLCATLPWVAVVSGAGVLLLGVAVRSVRLRLGAGRA
ncbi:APC family permease [Xylanimonas sp. McL0601]|uniref:APC family permease n=1 Tax=Xylanimonas sp. McL0601 TaxID=3414739 RepID=UPI003CEC789E